MAIKNWWLKKCSEIGAGDIIHSCYTNIPLSSTERVFNNGVELNNMLCNKLHDRQLMDHSQGVKRERVLVVIFSEFLKLSFLLCCCYI